ncbi:MULTISPECIES: Hsp20/alpha crystallin family protein [Caballeronia]|uniref:Hsp20/alpha crystallin family protein n=1 Tax=Caballeronia TaxID=1827195 RepID=UPI00045A133A|nr:Hsp20/alpha crystallin family protein [Caballeronia sp. LZ029]KAK43790.1 heat shock Hsp20 [Caballeronia jiangsuensis]MDR5744515.1 Hsp20/alpha crystallin family protein [Caballeronia sp. LZ029]BAO92502.1 molecular chaperone small heat shock protein fragment [Burkholderia sp. RPE67]BBQ02685.1 heat-shock protein Hsp20 [Burkholderia sp. SFA1]
MSDVYFGTDFFADLERMQRQLSGLFDGLPSSLRSTSVGTFPRINIGSTDDSIEIVAFAPGINPSQLDITVDKGMLSIAGRRDLPDGHEEAPDAAPGSTSSSSSGGTRQYARERFSGAFRRVIELPQQADPDKVNARYVDGCLLISVGKRETSRPRAIQIQ